MSIDKIVFVFAGKVIISSLALSQLYSANRLWLTAFVEASLFHAAFTGFCPQSFILKKTKGKTGPGF